MKKLSVLLVFVMLVSVFCAAAAQEKSYLERAYDGEFKGTTVTFDGPFVDNDQVFFEESIKPFEEATGIDIVYVGNKDFESTIQMRVEGGNAPDIADFPQPGLLGNLAKKGYMIDVRNVISEDWLKENYSEAWLDLAMMEGPDFPIALGVIRDVEAPTYDDAVNAQIEEVKAAKKYHNFAELLETNDIWEVK